MMQTQFEKNQIGIRPLRAEDAIAYHQAALEAVPEAFQFMPWCRSDYPLSEAEWWVTLQTQLWEQGQTYGFAIYNVATQKLLGATEIAAVNHQEKFANVGYWIRSLATGKGNTTTAASLAIQFAFQELQMEYVRIYCLPENVASRRIAEKLGAELIEEVPDYVFIHGQMRSAIYYKLNRSQFDLVMR